jgi:hypothetical protein
MKNPHCSFRTRSFLFIFAFAFLLITGSAGAQSVTLGTIPGSHFCSGDPISVSFIATGNWGHKNAFTLQVSDPSGSFSNGFLNLGSLVDTLPGTFTINARMPSAASTHYRLRILAASPYIASADNGSDIAVGSGPTGFSWEIVPSAGAIGTPVTFAATSVDYPVNAGDSQDSAFWDFGPGASPQKVTATGLSYHGLGFTQDVTYSTAGDKTVTLGIARPGGCGGYTITTPIHIYDCSTPSIPHDAIVIDSVRTADGKKTYWVNPGATLYFGDGDTIFAEPGSTLSGPTSPGYCIMYMKPGSVLNSRNGGNVVIYSNGASVSSKSSDFTLNCPTLDFDYTSAPPNSAFPASGVKQALNPTSITLSPNPTNGMLHIQGLPSDNITVSVFNVLGETVLVQEHPSVPNFTLDLDNLVPGAYYVRFATPNSVRTEKVIKN